MSKDDLISRTLMPYLFSFGLKHRDFKCYLTHRPSTHTPAIFIRSPEHFLVSQSSLLVSVDVAGTVGVAEVDEGGVDDLVLLALVQEILQVTEVPVAAPHSVPGAVLVQQEHLTRGEPALPQFKSFKKETE